MKTSYLLSALTLIMSAAALAAEPSPAPKMECCCKKDEKGKMACSEDKDDKSGDEHTGHSMGGMDHK